MRKTVYIFKLFITLIVLLALQGVVFAVTWQDEFESKVKEDWQLQGSDSAWRLEGGYLRAKIETQKQWRTIFEVYQYKNSPGPYENITVMAENIGTSGDVKFGIVVGKHFLDDDGILEEIGYYLFLTNDMQASRDGKVYLGPGRRWNTDALNRMTLHFDEGRFQLFGDDESRMDFIDANLKTIDIIGFVLVGYVTDLESTGEGWVDSITISGIPVTPKDKLTTTWGQLKRD